MTIQDTLKERGDRYGAFPDHAGISQGLKDVMRTAPRYNDLSPATKEALEMIQHKVARILNGDPTYADNWHDIAGYSTLVENSLEKGRTAPDSTRWTCYHTLKLGHNPSVSVRHGEKCPVCLSIND